MADTKLEIIDQIQQKIYQVEPLIYQIFKLSKELERITTKENK